MLVDWREERDRISASSFVAAGGLAINEAVGEIQRHAHQLTVELDELREDTAALSQLVYTWAACVEGRKERERLAVILRRMADSFDAGAGYCC